MYRIQRFNVLKTATVVGVMYMVVVAIFAVPFVLLFAFLGASGSSGAQTSIGGAFAVGIGVILVYGIIGWIVTAIACVIYNGVAAWIGGIEVMVEPVGAPPAPPAWMTSQPPPAPPPTG